MRILLINTNRLKDPLPVMPMGLCWIAASLERAGHETRLLDLCFSPGPQREIDRAITRFKPDVVGVSVRNIDTSNGYRPVFQLEEIKTAMILPLKRAFAGPIVLGGAAAGINGPELLDYLDIEYAVQGDGERAMVEFAGRLQRGESVSGLAGLIVRRNGATEEVNAPVFADDLDGLAVPRPQKYLNLAFYKVYNTPLQIQTKRGCGLHCAYCTYNRLEGDAYRLRSPGAIADEIEEFTKSTGTRCVEIVDSMFNVPLDHAKAVLREIASRNLGLRLSTMGMSPRFLDGELALLMKQAGFIEACFGIESVCDKTLATLGKNFTVEDIRRAATIIRPTGIPVSWFLLIGAPGETTQTIRETFGNIGRTASPFDLVNIAVGIRVYNGAPIADVWAREHNGRPADNFLRPVAYQPGPLSMKKLKALVSVAAAWHHNFLMFDEGANILLPFRLFFNTFFKNQPIWRGYIAMRLLEKFSGVFLIRALIIHLICRPVLKDQARN